MVLEARRDEGSWVSTPAGREAAIPAGWHRLRVQWTAGAGSGSLALFVDGLAADRLIGLSNETCRVDGVEWGVVVGSLTDASGSLDLDAFDPWR